ncbi:hypothetical protein TSMEX_001453 [Taenia solium]|eukprot:TsM_000350300 transcript=TsM_000350300 gene=TsM_000350300
MADASEEGREYGQDEPPAEAGVSVADDLHSALPTIAQSVPSVWPTGLNGGREEFSSICVGGGGYELSYLTQIPTITLRLGDQATWRAVRPHLVEMRVENEGRLINVVGNPLCRRTHPTLTVSVESLGANELYTVSLDMLPKYPNVYKYRSGVWMPLQTTKPYPPPNQASPIHVPSSAHRLGSDLMALGVNFSLAKVAADASTPINRNQLFVHRRQIYLPRYHIVRYLTAEEVGARQQSGVCAKGLMARLQSRS